MERWISADPVTADFYDPQGLNKYTYVRNDPINFVDPDGKQWFGDDGQSYCDIYWWDIASCGNFYNPWGWIDQMTAIWRYTGMIGATLSGPLQFGNVVPYRDVATEELRALLGNKNLLRRQNSVGFCK